MQRFDRYGIGIGLGVVLPLLFCVLYISNYHLGYLFQSLGSMSYPIISKLLLLSVFPNLALIFVFYTTDTWKLSKGVLMGAFPYMIAAVIFSSL